MTTRGLPCKKEVRFSKGDTCRSKKSDKFIIEVLHISHNWVVETL